MARDNPETNSITRKPKTVSHVAQQFSWVPLPCCSPPGCPFTIKSLASSACVSPRTIQCHVLDKTGEGNGDPLRYSCLENPMDRRTWQTTGHGVVVGRGGLPPKEWALVLHSEKNCLRRHVLTKQETLLEEGTGAESSRVREPRRTALPCGSQSRVLCLWD